MRGIPEFNFPAFDAAAKALREMGHIVFNPADNDRNLTAIGIPINMRTCLEGDLEWICRYAEGIALLSGWENSRGARAEYAAAKALDLPAFLVENIEGEIWLKAA